MQTSAASRNPFLFHATAYGLLVIAVLLQVLVWQAMLRNDFEGAIAWHALSSLLFPIPLWLLLPERFEKSRWLLLLLCLLCFFIPCIAGIALFFSLTLGARQTKQQAVDEVLLTEVPSIPKRIVDNIRYTQTLAGNLRATLESSTQAYERIRAVLATRKMEDSIAIPILQIALFDPIDEVRLLAYSMLNTKEKDISSRIQEHLNQLKDVALPAAERATRQRFIAESYWELAYLGLEQGQAKIYVLERADHFALLAMSYFITDSELYFLRAKIGLELTRYAQAAANLMQAKHYGLHEDRLAPYQAELAFAERRFADLGYFMHKIKQSGEKNTLSDMVNQWL